MRERRQRPNGSGSVAQMDPQMGENTNRMVSIGPETWIKMERRSENIGCNNLDEDSPRQTKMDHIAGGLCPEMDL